MGLDVYLKKCTDRKAAHDAEETYERLSDNATDEERTALREQLNIGKWGVSNLCTTIEIDDPTYPDHYFKIGYLRSSYNSSGINSVMSNRELPDLYGVFEPPDDEYEFVPDWNGCLDRAKAWLKQWDVYCSKPESKYNVLTVRHNMFMPKSEFPHSPKDAFREFSNEIEKEKNEDSPFKSYSNRRGEFYWDGLKIVAVLPGYAFNEPCVYIFYEDEGNLIWYRQAIEITIHTIEYVLAQPDKEEYYLAWSE